jgi:hypothetical protein
MQQYRRADVTAHTLSDRGSSEGMALAHDTMETAALMLRDAKVAIGRRFSYLGLTSVEVQGLVVLAWDMAERERPFLISVERTVKRWRRQGRVDEQWALRREDRERRKVVAA